MSDSTTVKHFETRERSPSLRLQERTYKGSPTRYVLLEERGADGWYRVGSVDLGFGPADARGRCAHEVIAEWHHTRFHTNGDRVRVGRRLLGFVEEQSFRVVLEEDREEVLGFGDRKEHDWEPQESWQFDGPGGEAE